MGRGGIRSTPRNQHLTLGDRLVHGCSRSRGAKLHAGRIALSVLGRPGVPSDTGAVTSGPQEHRVVERAGGPFHRPTQAAVTSDGEVFVSDGYGNARVHRFSADGELLKSWGAPGSADGEFNLPHGIAIDIHGRLLIADRENDRIQVFTAEGEHLESWTGLERPSDVASAAGEEVFYVSQLAGVEGRTYWGRVMPSTVSARIRVLDYHGRCLSTLETEDGEPPAGLISGHSICADLDGNLYVGQNVRLNQGEAYDGRTPRVIKLQRL
jgi:sugar lactone lactonase YvrE